MRDVGLSLLIFAGCTSAEPPATQQPSKPDTSAPAGVREAIEPEVSAAAQTALWRWKSTAATDEPEVFMPMPTSVVNGPTTVDAHPLAGGGVEVVQSRHGRAQWTATVGETHHSAAALAWAGDVLVAHYDTISSGAQLTRLDRESGKQVWTRPLKGLGPIDHSKYRNAVQVEVRGGKVWVYGREASGAYVEVRDLGDGHLMEHSLVEPGLVDLQWQEVQSPAVWGEPGFALPTGWSISEGSPVQLRHAPSGGSSRTVALPRSFGRCDTGAGLVRDGVLYLAHACASTSGARLYALSLSDLTWSWEIDLHAVGPVAHSAYANRVGIEWEDGRLLVYGDEAMGRYVEAIDPEHGSALVNKQWPRT